MARIVQTSDIGSQVARSIGIGLSYALGKQRLALAEKAQEDVEEQREYSRLVDIAGMYRASIPRGTSLDNVPALDETGAPIVQNGVPVMGRSPEATAYVSLLSTLSRTYGGMEELSPDAIGQMGLIVGEEGEQEVYTSLLNERTRLWLEQYELLTPEEKKKATIGESTLQFGAGEAVAGAQIDESYFQRLMSQIRTRGLEGLTPDQLQFLSYNFTDMQFTSWQSEARALISKAGLEGQLAEMSRVGLGAVTPGDVTAGYTGITPGLAQAGEAQNIADYVRANLSATVDNFGIVSFNELRTTLEEQGADAVYTYAQSWAAPNLVRDPETGLPYANPQEAALFVGYLSDDEISRAATLEYLGETFPTLPPARAALLVKWEMEGIPAADGVKVPLHSVEGREALQRLQPQLVDAANALLGVWVTADSFQEQMLNEIGPDGRSALYQIQMGLDFAMSFEPEARPEQLEIYTGAVATMYGENAARYMRRKFWRRGSNEGILLGGEAQPGQQSVEPGSASVTKGLDEMYALHTEGLKDFTSVVEFDNFFREVVSGGRSPTTEERTNFMKRVRVGGE